VRGQAIRFLPPLLNLSISAGLAMVDENFDVTEDNAVIESHGSITDLLKWFSHINLFIF
jgi:hypothetical protein